jgi:hypothetical protein
MKIAKLPNGIKLEFPDNMSDSEVQKSVKRMLGIKDGPSVEDNIHDILDKFTKKENKKIEVSVKDREDPLTPVLDEYLKQYKKFHNDRIRLTTAVSKDSVTVIKNSSKDVAKSVDGLVKQLSSLENKDLNKTLFDVTKSLGAVIAQQLDNLVKELKKNNQSIKSMEKNIVSSNNELAAAFRVNTQTLSELVKKTGEPRKVIYDSDNKIKGIE